MKTQIPFLGRTDESIPKQGEEGHSRYGRRQKASQYVNTVRSWQLDLRFNLAIALGQVLQQIRELGLS